MGKVKYPESVEQAKALHSLQSIRVQVKHLELSQLHNVPNPADLVFGEKQHLEGGERMYVLDILDLIALQVKIEQVGQRYQIFYFGEFVLLESQHFELLFPLEQGHMVQLHPVQIHLLKGPLSLHRPPVAHPHLGNLRQLGKYYVSTLLHSSQLPVLQQIPKSLVLLMQRHIVKTLTVYYFLAGIDRARLRASQL